MEKCNYKNAQVLEQNVIVVWKCSKHGCTSKIELDNVWTQSYSRETNWQQAFIDAQTQGYGRGYIEWIEYRTKTTNSHFIRYW